MGKNNIFTMISPYWRRRPPPSRWGFVLGISAIKLGDFAMFHLHPPTHWGVSNTLHTRLCWFTSSSSSSLLVASSLYSFLSSSLALLLLAAFLMLVWHLLHLLRLSPGNLAGDKYDNGTPSPGARGTSLAIQTFNLISIFFLCCPAVLQRRTRNHEKYRNPKVWNTPKIPEKYPKKLPFLVLWGSFFWYFQCIWGEFSEGPRTLAWGALASLWQAVAFSTFVSPCSEFPSFAWRHLIGLVLHCDPHPTQVAVARGAANERGATLHVQHGHGHPGPKRSSGRARCLLPMAYRSAESDYLLDPHCFKTTICPQTTVCSLIVTYRYLILWELIS